MRRSVRVFAEATFQEILIKCLFFNEKKAYVFDKNAILTPDHVRQHSVVYLRNLLSKGSKQVSGHMQFSQTINLIGRYTSPECTCLQADLPTDSSHKL